MLEDWISDFVVAKVNIQNCHHGHHRVHSQASRVVQDSEEIWSVLVPWKRHLDATVPRYNGDCSNCLFREITCSAISKGDHAASDHIPDERRRVRAVQVQLQTAVQR